MSNISQQVLYQAFNQGLGTHSQLPGYSTPTSLLNSYTPQVSRPMTFASFTPTQVRMIQVSGGVVDGTNGSNGMKPSLYSNTMVAPRETRKTGFGVL
jgi:hypothetical protein